MKVKLYFGFKHAIAKSGIGHALKHQKTALTLNNIEYTTDKNDLDYDILHINTIYPDSLKMIMQAKIHHKKIIYHGHTTEEDFRNSFRFSNILSGLYKRWITYLYRFADYIITPTPYSKKLIENYDVDCPVYAISNGVDISRFQVSDEHIQKFKEKFQINDEIVIICVGWLFERKGFDTFVEVAKAFPHVKFIWFGDVVLSHPTTKIQNILQHLPDNVLLPGYVDSETLIGAYGYARLFFFPSREETEGIVVLEALACKCQVLVRDIGAFEPWLKDGENCYKGKDEDDFIRIINQLLDRSLPSTIDAGYQVAYDRRLEVIGQELKDIYERVYQEA